MDKGYEIVIDDKGYASLRKIKPVFKVETPKIDISDLETPIKKPKKVFRRRTKRVE